MAVNRQRTQLNDDFAAIDLRQMQQAPRYTDWMAAQIRPHCGRRVLEVGAGIGSISQRLLRHAEYVCALEPNPACFEALHRDLGGSPGFECHPWRVEDCTPQFAAARQIDTVVCVNVLEHLEADALALERFRAMLPPAGRLVLVVPAVPAAYGAIDAALGHYRRYSRRRLRAMLAEAGFSVDSLRFANLPGLIAWSFNARIARRVQQSDTQIKVFDRWIVPWWSRIETLVPPPLGQSLVAAAHVAL